MNPHKLQCDVSFQLKPVNAKDKSKLHETFDIEPQKGQVPPHGHIFATVFFKPKSMQEYDCIFEASVDNAAIRAKPLSFQIHGEGSLPRVYITHPKMKNEHGHGILNFRCLVQGQHQMLPIILQNSGTLPAYLSLQLDNNDTNSYKVFPNTTDVLNPEPISSVTLCPNEHVNLNVVFKPTISGQFDTTIHIRVLDNDFDNLQCELHGECYTTALSFENLPPLPLSLLGTTSSSTISFGGLALREKQIRTFTMRNTSDGPLRFNWDHHDCLLFEPRVGHLPVASCKDIAITLSSSEPLHIKSQPIWCEFQQIVYQNADGHNDWDDRIKSIKWIDSTDQSTGRNTKKKVYEVEPEPAHDVATDVNSEKMALFVDAMVNCAVADVNTTQLIFDDLELFSKKQEIVTLTNSGEIDITFQWDLYDRTSGQHRPATTNRSFLNTAVPYSPHDPVFSISPDAGKLAPGGSMEFTIGFQPRNVSDYEMIAACRIPNLSTNLQPIEISLIGQGTLPEIHFLLPDKNDYHANVHSAELTKYTPSNHILNICPIGLGIKTVTSVWVLNPTDRIKDWTLEWVPDDRDVRPVETIRCLTQRGQLEPGRKQLLQFEFNTTCSDTIITNWLFSTGDLEHSLTVEATARDPKILLDCTHLSFLSLITGHRGHNHVHLVNHDDVPVSFNIQDDAQAIKAAGWNLEISPTSGTIPAKSKIQLSLSVEACRPGELAQPVKILCKGKLEPMIVYVKAIAHSMTVEVTMEDSNGRSIGVSDQFVNKVNFGSVEVNSKQMKVFNIVNLSEHAIEYNWIPHFTNKIQVHINPTTEVVAPLGSTRCVFTYEPRKANSSLPSTNFELKITHGTRYLVEVEGDCVPPGIDFSFTHHDFGPCFVHKVGMPIVTRDLEICNTGSTDVSVDCRFEPTKWLDFEFQPVVLKPRNRTICQFKFRPIQEGEHSDVVPFIINGISTYKVNILGHGTEMKVNLKNRPKNDEVKLGAIRIGEIVKRRLTLINRSATTTTFQLTATPSDVVLQDQSVFNVHPGGFGESISLLPGKSREIEIIFSPKSRVRAFKCDIMLDCLGTSSRLVTVLGSCLAVCVELDVEALPFGTVTLESSADKRVMLSNTGDIGARFEWDQAVLSPYFTINPAIGYLSPGTQQPLTVTFRPSRVERDVRLNRVKCKIEGMREPLHLTITGACSQPNYTKESPVNFHTIVRQSETKSISLKNTTNQRWVVRSRISGEDAHWWRPANDLTIIEAQQFRVRSRMS